MYECKFGSLIKDTGGIINSQMPGQGDNQDWCLEKPLPAWFDIIRGIDRKELLDVISFNVYTIKNSIVTRLNPTDDWILFLIHGNENLRFSVYVLHK